MTYEEMLALKKNAIVYRMDCYGPFGEDPAPATYETAVVCEVSKAEGAGVESMKLFLNGKYVRYFWDNWHLTARDAYTNYHNHLTKAIDPARKAVVAAEKHLEYVLSEEARLFALVNSVNP